MRIERISIINTAILLKSNLQTQYSSHQNDVIIHRNRETKFIIHIEAQKTLHSKNKFKRKKCGCYYNTGLQIILQRDSDSIVLTPEQDMWTNGKENPEVSSPSLSHEYLAKV